jgi:hypothetical protein
VAGDSSRYSLSEGCEKDKEKSENSTSLCYFTSYLSVEGKHRAILYLLNARGYIMHVGFNGGKSISMIFKDQENSIVRHEIK